MDSSTGAPHRAAGASRPGPPAQPAHEDAADHEAAPLPGAHPRDHQPDTRPDDHTAPTDAAPGRHHSHSHDHDSHGHGHGAHAHPVSRHADQRWIGVALGLIVAFMAVEVVVGVLAHSLALLSDAAHMLTDAAALALALVAIRLAQRPARGAYTYGLKRVEILSAQLNGLSLLLLAVWLTYEAVRRLISPPAVNGTPVLVIALVGVVVNLAATTAIRRADRTSLNIEGAFQHILTDLAGFAATAVAGAIVLTTGFSRADALASLVVVLLMVRAGAYLVRDSGRIFLEAAPEGVDPHALGVRLARLPDVVEVHDLHVWAITSGQPALSAHVLVRPGSDCHALRGDLEAVLHGTYGIDHTTLQVDHAPEAVLHIGRARPTPGDAAHGSSDPGNRH